VQQGQASVTALGAAGHRAAHQVLERGLVFADPLALRILGRDADDAIALAREKPERRPLRLFIAMRSRFAEDSACRAIEKGVRQILVMGAGLDTFAYRLEPCEGLRVFELDHPATQAEKRRRLTDAQIAKPAHVAYVAHDFEHGRMTDALEAGGFDPGKRTFVLWLGVTPYLTKRQCSGPSVSSRACLVGRKSSSTTPTRQTRSTRQARATSTAKWRRGLRRAASRSDAISIRPRCMLTPANSGSRKSRISTERRSSPVICGMYQALPAQGRAGMSSGWRRFSSNTKAGFALSVIRE
jgi:methyltransferase (TIGR00027 family)